MVCAMVVFFTIGYATQSSTIKPVYTTTTMEKAQLMLTDPLLNKHWTELNVYPVIRPCEV